MDLALFAEPRNLFVYRRDDSEGLAFFFETPDGTQFPAARELLEAMEQRYTGYGPVRSRAKKEANVVRTPRSPMEEASARFGRTSRPLLSRKAQPSMPLQFDMEDL